MKRSILMQLDAKKIGGQDRRKSGRVEMIKDLYWEKYRVRLSKKEAEKIMITERAQRCHKRVHGRW